MKFTTLLLLAASYVQADHIAVLPRDEDVIELDLDKIVHEHGELKLDGEKEWAHRLMLPKDKTVVFRMVENPSTGYTWQVKDNACGEQWMKDIKGKFEAP